MLDAVIDRLVDAFGLSMSLAASVWMVEELVTARLVRLYREGAHDTVVLEDGDALSPLFGDDAAAGRVMGPRFTATLLGLALAGWGSWYYGVALGRQPSLYEFVLGLVGLTPLPSLLRVGLLVVLFRDLRGSGGAEGRIMVPSWMGLRLAAVLHGAGALLWASSWVLTGRPLFAGGLAGCGLLALTHAWVASRRRPRVGGD